MRAAFVVLFATSVAHADSVTIGAKPVVLLLGDGQPRPPLQVHYDRRGPDQPIGLDLSERRLQIVASSDQDTPCFLSSSTMGPEVPVEQHQAEIPAHQDDGPDAGAGRPGSAGLGATGAPPWVVAS